MLIIGEKINSSIPSVAGAIEKMDKDFIQKLAQDQVAAGADIIDVNAGAFLNREIELLTWLVKVVQEAVDVPLCIDSPNPAALKAALAVADKKAMVNSISAEEERYKNIIPLVKQSQVIALCMDDRGIPGTAAGRLKVARSLTDRLISDGVNPDNIYLDVMVQPIGTDDRSGLAALDTVRAIKEEIAGVHITSGLSNVSFGLPKRKLLNQAYAVVLMSAGMDALFIDPLDERMMGLVYAAKALLGDDEFSCEYLAAYRQGKLKNA